MLSFSGHRVGLLLLILIQHIKYSSIQRNILDHFNLSFEYRSARVNVYIILYIRELNNPSIPVFYYLAGVLIWPLVWRLFKPSGAPVRFRVATFIVCLQVLTAWSKRARRLVNKIFSPYLCVPELCLQNAQHVTKSLGPVCPDIIPAKVQRTNRAKESAKVECSDVNELLFRPPVG